MTLPLVIIPCGATKRRTRSRAMWLYTGSFFKAHLAAALRLTEKGGKFLILSGKHGLLDPDAWVEPYEQTLTGKGAVSNATIREQARARGLANAQNVIVLGGAAYRNAAKSVWPTAQTPTAHARSMGDHMRLLSQLGR